MPRIAILLWSLAGCEPPACDTQWATRCDGKQLQVCGYDNGGLHWSSQPCSGACVTTANCGSACVASNTPDARCANPTEIMGHCIANTAVRCFCGYLTSETPCAAPT